MTPGTNINLSSRGDARQSFLPSLDGELSHPLLRHIPPLLRGPTIADQAGIVQASIVIRQARGWRHV